MTMLGAVGYKQKLAVSFWKLGPRSWVRKVVWNGIKLGKSVFPPYWGNAPKRLTAGGREQAYGDCGSSKRA
jgi:hypothetical protein